MGFKCVVFTAFVLCIGSCVAQLNGLLLSSLFGGDLEFEGPFDNGFGTYGVYTLNQLTRRILALERNVQTGAFGGCESGVIGPFTRTMRSGQINFRGRFLTPPAVSLALSDIMATNASEPMNFQIRPSAVSNTMVGVTFTDNTDNMATAFVSYMACPSNTNVPVTA